MTTTTKYAAILVLACTTACTRGPEQQEMVFVVNTEAEISEILTNASIIKPLGEAEVNEEVYTGEDGRNYRMVTSTRGYQAITYYGKNGEVMALDNNQPLKGRFQKSKWSNLFVTCTMLCMVNVNAPNSGGCLSGGCYLPDDPRDNCTPGGCGPNCTILYCRKSRNCVTGDASNTPQ